MIPSNDETFIYGVQ